MSVQIFDNFLSKNELDILTTEIRQPKYEWGHTSNGSSDIEYPWLLMHLSDNKFFNTVLTSKIEKTVNMTFNTERIYMNGQMYGSESGFHVDTTDTNGFTFLLFVHECNESNADSMGGYFYYKLNGEIRCIEPIKNRAVFFNGNILHKGCAFNRHIKTLRQSIAWKLYRTDSNLNETTASYDIELIRKDISAVFDSFSDLSGVEQFKPLLSLLNKPYFLNCYKAAAICFNDSTVQNTISQYLSTLNT
jgi:hypothetical protein